MELTLSLNTNPLVNRFAEPDDLIDTVARDLKIRDLQLTHEFINPSWPASTLSRLTREMKAAMARTGVRVTSGMTGPYGRLNHFGHPDAEVRRYYIDWFKTFADIIADLGGTSVGTQFAIFTYRDYDDPIRREDLINIAIDCWRDVADHARAAGLSFLFWEPMSIGREFGETIQSCLALQERLKQADMAVPMWMMADIDHGDVTSDNPDDYDPYAWARAVPKHSPIIHIKQSLMDKGGHRPFTADFNARGRIQPEPLLEAFATGGAVNNEICLELSFKEREPNDREVIPQIAESIAFWAPFIDTGAGDLHLS
ncbi:sugar phosphate isomerase/epimerase [Allorhizobium sp. BGMRC 0089]|uniref:sugar phosphate isomerase/epimerase family protein n=1 Tax=Allorhizobium sonneratiae TaxID=2934936 RepID=UPI002033885F|nr:TIM barrel protein [Allorhizobium sonneratiae]MCM2293265.1 sugar phosphate isomerase/epimerase [Allorhizobium sonneratiae]